MQRTGEVPLALRGRVQRLGGARRQQNDTGRASCAQRTPRVVVHIAPDLLAGFSHPQANERCRTCFVPPGGSAQITESLPISMAWLLHFVREDAVRGLERRYQIGYYLDG